MARILPHTKQSAGRTLVLWGETEELNRFFDDLTPDAEDGGELRTVTVQSLTYRRYSGGPLINRRSHLRTFDTNRGIGNLARPGRRFWIEPPDAELLGITIQNNPNQFSFQGPWFALKALAFEDLPEEWVIRSTGGRAFVVPSEDAPPALPGAG